MFNRKQGLGKIANKDFWSPLHLPPYRIDFAKNRKKSELTQNGLIRREIEKKNCPLVTPPKKTLKNPRLQYKTYWPFRDTRIFLLGLVRWT